MSLSRQFARGQGCVEGGGGGRGLVEPHLQGQRDGLQGEAGVEGGHLAQHRQHQEVLSTIMQRFTTHPWEISHPSDAEY